jgi:hypothetical protein
MESGDVSATGNSDARADGAQLGECRGARGATPASRAAIGNAVPRRSID